MPPHPSATLPFPAGVLDNDGRLTQELPCRRCHYNLLFQPGEADCPECGLPVRDTLFADRLRYADPAWLESLRCGLLWHLLLIGASFAVGIILVIMRFIDTDSPLPERVGHLFMLLILTPLWALASWWITAPEPDSPIAEPSAARRAARVLVLVPVAYAVPSLALGVAELFSPDLLTRASSTTETFTPLGVVHHTLASVTEFLGFVGLLCLAFFFRGLARRADRLGLAKQTTALAWVWIGLMVALALLTAALTLPGSGAGTQAAGSAVLGCGGGLVGLAALVWTLVLSILYLRMLGAQVRAAEHFRALAER
ncbi:MAG: hypothetical protein AAFX76_01695 [Planctomycetota bacterium]